MRKRAMRGATALVAVALLIGCAPESSGPTQSGPEQSSSAPSSPIPTAEPEPPTPAELRHQRATEWVDIQSTRELVGSVIMVSIPGVDQGALHAFMENGAFGGFVIMGSNVPGNPEELQAITAALTLDPTMPPLIAIDEEGGTVTRLPWDTLPGADTLRFEPPAKAATTFSQRSELLTNAGINVNFGVVADWTSEPSSFIYWRSLGDTPEDAAQRVEAAVTGEHGKVASTLKHFPGHGAAPGDSHFGVPSTGQDLETWNTQEAVPFRAGVDAGAELLMFGHLQYTQVSQLPASLAPEWYAIARDQLEFDGVTITDDLGMLPASGVPEYQNDTANTIAAIEAGADIALIIVGMDASRAVDLVDGVTAAAENGTLSQVRLREAALRTAELRLLLADRASGQTEE